MALGPVSEQILDEVEAVTGLPVQVVVDDRLRGPTQLHRVEGIADPLTSPEPAGLIHAGLKATAPQADSGIPLEREYQTAVNTLSAQ